MESEKVVYDLVDSIASLVLIVQENESGYTSSYANQAMRKVLDKHLKEGESSVSQSEELSGVELPDSLQKLMLQYAQEKNADTYTMYDVEVFDSLYNVSFSRSEKGVLLLFSEIKDEEFLNNITFEHISEACNAIVIVLDKVGAIVDINECFSDIVGMDKNELIGQSFFETFIPGDREKLTRYFQEIMHKDVYHQHFVTPLKGQNNTVYRINWQVSKIVKHEQMYIIAVGSDISKFVDENSNLKKQLTSIQLGFDYFPFAVGYMNAEGVFTKMNSRFMKMFRIEDENVKVRFDKIPIFKNHIDFDSMSEHIKLIKEMSYKIDYTGNDKAMQFKVNVRLLSGTNESSKFYIVVVQNI